MIMTLMNHTNTLMVAIFIAVDVMLVAGLISIPTIERAALANKGGTSNENAEPIRSCKSPNSDKDNNDNGLTRCKFLLK